MPQQNRVNPYGEIISSHLRGSWMGNRGCLHRERRIVRPWNTKRWITCVLEFKGWVAPKWAPGRWTPLFFYDEALALAAGHRPCALCRRQDYVRYQAAVGISGADAIDAQLQAECLEGRRKRLHVMAWSEVPAGAYVDLGGIPHVVLSDGVHPWSSTHGYGDRCARPRGGNANVLTPPLSIRAIVNKYDPQIGTVAAR